MVRGRGVTVVRVRFNVRGQTTMRKLATVPPIKTEGSLLCECVCLYYPPVVLRLKKLELLLDAVQ